MGASLACELGAVEIVEVTCDEAAGAAAIVALVVPATNPCTTVNTSIAVSMLSPLVSRYIDSGLAADGGGSVALVSARKASSTSSASSGETRPLASTSYGLSGLRHSACGTCPLPYRNKF